ncbi:MAG: gliding motility-associated C-terminal domain-containing protein [Algoriphagus sp.]|nr:gliding motility-associated C-terminal domain-containing protein [Algoriphagus sp.]
MGDLNDYLTAFTAARPAGPVTVAQLTTSSTNPTLTGTATLASGESLSIEFNGVVYTTSTGVTRPTATTWSFTVPNSVTLTAGTYNVVATITNAAGYTLSDTSTGELIITSTNFAGLGCVTIVASGGAAENSTWTYVNNVITPNSATNVSIDASVVVAKLALGGLTIASPCITINADVIGGNHTNALFLNSNKITQAAGVSVTTQGGNITYLATNSPQTSSIDHAIEIGVTSGSRSSINANGGNISLNASYATTGAEGGNNGEPVLFLGPSDILTSAAGTISLVGDATNNLNTPNCCYHSWGIEIGDSRIQTANGNITITGTGGKFSNNSRGIVIWSGRTPRILSASGTITFVENKPVGLTGTYQGNQFQAGANDLFIGADGVNQVSSTSNIIIRADKINIPTGFSNSGKLVKFNTSGTVLFESVGTSFEVEPTLSGLSLGSTVTGFTLGKTTNTSAITVSSATTLAGPVSVYGGNITVDGNINTSAGTANGDILFKGTGNITQNASRTITTNGGDVTLWSDRDASGTATTAGGTIALLNASSITSSGGNITLAGGADANSDGIPDGYAIGAFIPETRGAGNVTAGLSLDNATVNAGAGNVLVRGQGTGAQQNFQMGTRLYGGSITGADINIDAIGSIGGGSSSNWGLSLEGFSIEGTGSVVLTGKGGRAGSSNSDFNQAGVEIRRAIDNTSDHSQVQATGTGTILINGQGGSGAFVNPVVSNSLSAGIRIEALQTAPILSANGAIILNGTSGYSGRGSGMIIGSPITSTSGNVTLKGLPSVEGTTNLNGNIEINGTVTTSGAITLESPGAVTQTAAMIGGNLGLIGTGTFTLTNTSNNVATVAGGTNAARLGNLSLTDASGGLTIGTVGSVNGLTTSGTITVETLAGDLSLAQSVGTTNTTTNAIVLNAGKSSAIGTATGGSILVSGSPTVTTGTGGIVKLFSGSDANSTNLTTLVGGTANTRNGVDETTSTFSPALVANGKYALYRTSVQLAAPVITSFTPTTAGNGETVVITGTGFTGVTVVKFGNVNATSFVVNSDTQITAVVGAAQSGDVFVQNSAGSDTEAGFIFKVVELKFEGNTLDQTAADRDATIVGTVTYGPGASGQAICFTNNNVVNGTTVQNYLRLPDDLIRGRGANFTISLRFKTATYGAILGYQNAAVGPVSQYVPILYVQSDGKLSANLWQGTPLNRPLTVLSANRVDDNNWHKVEFSAAAGSITVYIDGVLAGTSTGTTDHLSMSFNQLGAVNTAGVWTGDPIDGWFGFNGCIDEFIIVDKSLTASQIQQVTQLPQPTITSFAPTTAKSGETVVITGTNLSGTSAVKLGGVNARSFTVVSATEVRAIVGKNATVTTDIEVTTGAGAVTASTFTFDCTSNALDFDGTNDHVVIGDQIENLGAFTQEAWVYWKGSTLDYSEIFTKETVSAFAITKANKLHANFGNGSTWGAGVNSTTLIPLNTWTHVAVTRSTSGVVKLYINGVLDASTATLALTGGNTNSRVIGAKLVGSTLFGPFTGAIDELKAWNTERTAQQILAGMNSELVGNDAGLIAYYNFNQGVAGGTNTSVTTLSNLTSGANLNGTLTNLSKSGTSSNFVTGVWPVIFTQPNPTASFCPGTGSLSVSAAGQQLAYQWYSNSSATTTGGTAIANATEATFTIPNAATGTNYYYVVVSGTCSQSVTSSVSTVTITSGVAFTYPAVTSVERTLAVTAIAPTISSGTISSFAISPSLPAGLTFNLSTGSITGTPTATSSATTYTVTGTTASGCTSTATFSLGVFNAVAPSALSYSPATQTVRQGSTIEVMTPTISGGAPTYTISPALPAGLSINATTGIISGTLTAAQTGSVTYTVTATNTGGSTTATVTLVFNTAPTNIGLAPAAVAENAASGTTVGTLTATDADTGDTFTYALVSGTGSTDNASFAISGATLSTAAVFDFETKTSYSVRVRVTDAGGLTYEKALTITVTDVNEDRDGDGVKDNEELADGTDPVDACSFEITSQNATPSDAWKAADCDNDGLTNQREKDLGTDPLDADTDGDGVPDGVEVTDGTDPLDGTEYKDADGDLVPDFVEAAEGTATGDSLKYKDSDKDGVPDYIELRDGTDPNDKTDFKDVDGGGVPDYVEAILFPNLGLPASIPNLRGDDARDSDGDGVPDYQEFLENTDPLDSSDFLDTDGDNVPNYVERLDGTDPNNFNEFKDSDGDGVANFIQARSVQLSVLEELVLAWGTKNHLSLLPTEVEVGIFSGEKIKFQVQWNKTETLNILKRGTYELTGTLVLPKGYYNPYKVNGLIRVVVLPKPAPRDVTIDKSTFVGSTSVFFIGVGSFAVNDPVDNIHVVSFLGDGYDNKYFFIKDNILYWNSAERAPGKTTFSIVVRVTDRDGNTLDKFFTITRTRPVFNSVTIYNTFTPNGDRFNDTWGVPEIRFYEGARISVYEKGGARVFYTENPDVRWDGTYNGKEMPVGSYYWVIQLEETGETRRGIVNLLRK